MRFFAFAMPTESHNNGARRGYDHKGLLGQRAQVPPAFISAGRIVDVLAMGGLIMTQQYRTCDSRDGRPSADFIATVHIAGQQRSLREKIHHG